VTVADAPWLGALLEERERFVGKPRRLWRARLFEPWKVNMPPAKLRVALRVLDRLAKDKSSHACAPRSIRERLFLAAAQDADRDRVLASVARELALTQEQLLENMFADLPEERRLVCVPGELSSVQLALLCNESIVFELLQRALRVRIEARGQMRAVVRHAKWTGLLCVFAPDTREERAILEVSGPYALFRHTRLYGRALASLVPRLARCDAYRLEADCVQPGGREVGRLVLKSNDPIHPARALPAYDSQVEARFARDFGKLALDWDLIREPAPIAAGAGMCFPDFLLRHRTTGQQFWLEIVGFWTPDYLSKKLAQLRAAGLSRLILCVDDNRSCAAAELESLGSVVRFRKRIDPSAVIALIDQHPA
jgi:predicted nuclease of restriction endonuclease-like RecB superfamily